MRIQYFPHKHGGFYELEFGCLRRQQRTAISLKGAVSLSNEAILVVLLLKEQQPVGCVRGESKTNRAS